MNAQQSEQPLLFTKAQNTLKAARMLRVLLLSNIYIYIINQSSPDSIIFLLSFRLGASSLLQNTEIIYIYTLFKFRAVATFLYTTRASDWLFGG